MNKQIKISSLNQLRIFAENISKCLKGNEVILLKGNLASGKTTFTKFLVSAIDKHLEDEVNSPTFTVMNVYETGYFPVYHIDLYRVKNFDFSEFLGEGVVVIEWAEENLFDEMENIPVIFIEIEYLSDTKRLLKIKTKNAEHIDKCLSL